MGNGSGVFRVFQRSENPGFYRIEWPRGITCDPDKVSGPFVSHYIQYLRSRAIPIDLIIRFLLGLKNKKLLMSL